MPHRPILFLALAALPMGACEWSAPPARAASLLAAPDSMVVVRRLPTEGYPYAIFPDASRLVVSDTSANLFVQEIATGALTPLTDDGSWMGGGWPEDVAVDPAGRRVAFTWRSQDDGLELRLAGADGARPRTNVRFPLDAGWLDLSDWTPDGRAIVGLRQDKQRAHHLVLIDPEDGGTEDVYDFGWRRPGSPKYSPDGRLVAVVLRAAEDGTDRDLYVLDPASGDLREVVDLDRSVSLADWAPDGSALYFTTHRDGIATLWRQWLDEGRAAGAPERVRGDLARFSSLGWAGRGLAFMASYRDVSLRHVQLTEGSMGVASPPAAIDERIPNFFRAATWSPDAQHVATLETGPTIAVRSRTGGEERVFEPAAVPHGFEWTEDGLFVMAERQGRRGIFHLDFDTGGLRHVEDLEPLRALRLPQHSRDGSMRLLVRSGETPGSPAQVVVIDRRSGEERILFEGDPGTLAFSPDGRHVARLSDTLYVHSVASGAAHALYRPERESWIKGGSLGWTPDSRAVLIVEQHIVDGQANSIFRRVALDGTVTEVFNAAGPGGAVNFGLSADGRHLAYLSASEDEPPAEAWIIEGLEP